MDRKQGFYLATKKYIDLGVSFSFGESQELVKSGKYEFLLGKAAFYSRSTEPYKYLLVRIEDEQQFMSDVVNIFHSKVVPRTVRESFLKAIVQTRDDAKFALPFATDEQEHQYLELVYDFINHHYERQYDAIVPLFQIRCESGVKLPLANAVLCAGEEIPCLADVVPDEAFHEQETTREPLTDCSFLTFRVAGDIYSRLEQVEVHVERALQVLRFIYPWKPRDYPDYHAAQGVSVWRQSHKTTLFLDYETGEKNFHGFSELPIEITGNNRISNRFILDANDNYRLDDINFHFQTSATNPVSERICRSLGFYDTAAQSSVAQFAFSNFVISIDILLPSEKVKKCVFTGYLNSLIEHGKLYTGNKPRDNTLVTPETTSRQERERLTTADFREFYTTRGQILHGSKENKYKTSISKSQVMKARQIAHNAIRAYAYLARAFGWETDRQAKEWFKSPHSPPKEANT